mmetsp:Transcript_124036/g.358710  ORF Transcript_124036/g.358710 Transcript_124036/m.358710 type:complete len:282 (-) Transcript_124036:71-916(-)
MAPESNNQDRALWRHAHGPQLPCVPCGIVSGLVMTGALNPWDRALYLSVVHRTSFFDRSNWQHPFRGILQTVGQRGLSSGLYFPLEEACSRWTSSAVVGGQLAGIINGAMLNPIALVKHQNWGSKEGASFVETSMHLYRYAGLKVFTHGLAVTMCRDAIFGFCFSLRKTAWHCQDERGAFAASMVFAALGTVLSSPFNYIRNITYASILASDGTSRSMRRRVEALLLEFAADVRRQETPLRSAQFVQERLKLGWGSFRVAVGMAMLDFAYSACCRFLNGGV